MMSAVIHARNLVKRFGNFTAVAGIDFEVQSGEIFGFLGPNGSGKTTTIRMMLGLLPPTAGVIQTLGEDVTRHSERIRPRVGYMSQKFSLYNDLTVIENLRFYGRAYGLRNLEFRERIDEALKMAGLAGREDQRTRDLAGGWRQRLALAAAILHRPELVFLDEPTAGVDPVSRRAFWDLLYDLVAEGITIFVTTHYMDEAEHCHKLALIQRGKIIASGSPEDIKTNMMQGQVLELSPDDPVHAISILREARDRGQLPVGEISLYGSLLHIVAGHVADVQPLIRDELNKAGIDPGMMEVIEPSLEDVFIASMQ
jgi:ABC-2 type transport system ATP-binding protein